MRINGQRSNTNILVDGHNILYRSHFGYVERDAPLNIRSRKFNPSWSIELVYGVLTLTSSFLSEIDGAHNLYIFYDGKPKRRIEKSPDYKSTRESKKVDSGLDIDVDGITGRGEVEFLSSFFRRAGATVFRDMEEETDDLIATFISKHPNDVNIIISDDRDFFQLVGGKTVQYRPCTRSFYDEDRIPSYMEEKYKVRVGASGIRMFKTLTGDSSDNIIGIPRIRKKLVERFCGMNIEEFLKADHSMFSKSEQQKIKEGADRLRTNWDLVSFYDDLDLESAKRPSCTDFNLCEKALETMNIPGVDLSPFKRIKPQGTQPVVNKIVELPDWLSDI